MEVVRHTKVWGFAPFHQLPQLKAVGCRKCNALGCVEYSKVIIQYWWSHKKFMQPLSAVDSLVTFVL
jgi:hypothetical protein